MAAFLAALRFVTSRPAISRPGRLVPLRGILVGCVGAALFWLSAQFWPTNVAVVLAMLATFLMTADPRTAARAPLYSMFLVLIKYNALMALSATSLSFPLPEFIALGVIMIAAHAASHALVGPLMPTKVPKSPHVSTNDLSVALLAGLAPAALLGIPGLIGLLTAIFIRLLFATRVVPKLAGFFRGHLDVKRQVIEVGFYLGALATWKYV